MSLPANMATQAATRSTTWASFIKIRLADGTVIAVTDHDRDLTFSIGDADGSVTYYASDAVEVTAARSATDRAIDQIEVIGAIDSSRIREDDLHLGRYNNAHVVAFKADWSAPTSGQKYEFRGDIGVVQSQAEGFTVEIVSLLSAYQRLHGFTISPQCPKSFGSTSGTERYPLKPCGVVLDPPAWEHTTSYAATVSGDRLVGDRVSPTTPNGFIYRVTTAGTSGGSEPTWPTTSGGTVTDGTITWTAEPALAITGTVTAVTSQLQFTASGIAVAEDTFSRGEIEWLTGNNAGVGFNSPVAYDDGAGGISLYRSPVRAIQIGDTFRAFKGCNRSQAACIGFRNWKNFLGHTAIPPRTV